MNDTRFQSIVADILGIAPSSVTDDLSADDIETWDSFAQVNLMVAFEEAYDVQFDGEHFMTLRSVRDLRSTVAQHAGAT